MTAPGIATHREVCDLFLNGMTYGQVARRTGLTPGQVAGICRRGGARRPRHSGILTQTVEALKALYQIADEIDGEIDEQTYDMRSKADFDLPDDADLNANITAKQYRQLNAALHLACLALSPRADRSAA